MWALRSSCRREPPPRAKLGRPAQVVVPGGGLFALASTLVRAIIISLHYARLHAGEEIIRFLFPRVPPGLIRSNFSI